jgi:ATP-dependent helicase/nuclease subunit A
LRNARIASEDAMTPNDHSRLTEEQERPLSVRGASIALESGAGCGKTTVLTARYFRALEEGKARPSRSIVALTFTNKAARELRSRIRDRCRRRLAAGPDRGRWRSVLRGLEAAPIGTFHDFAARWLRDHAVAVGIDPDFTILDESIAASIREAALAGTLRGWLADCNPDLIDLAVEFGLTPLRQALSALVASRALADLDAWSNRSAGEIVAEWKTVWKHEGRPASMRRLRLAARRCLDLLAAHECTNPTMRARCEFLLEKLARLESETEAVPDTWLGEIKEQARVQGGGKKEHWQSSEIYEQVKGHFDELRAEIKRFIDRSQWDEAATLEAAEHGRRLARLAVALEAKYAGAKRLQGGLDFDDLMIMMRNLLRDRPGLAATIDDRVVKLYLVDEFQDTDLVQGTILETLCGESSTTGGLFVVGDAKQSIYRFRGAEPRIFQQFRNGFPWEGRHALTENFRSIPAILDFVNALFAEAFEGPQHALKPGKPSYPATSQPAVEFLWAAEAGDEDGGKTRAPIRERRKVEARWIARRLRQRLDAGWKVRTMQGDRRDAHAGDIALLFRAMPGVGVYEAALAAEGLDYHVIGGSAFYAQQEIHDLINVLSSIEDPLDGVALAGALRSPFFCVSDDGLYWLALSRFGALPDGLEHAGDIAELAPIDRGHAERARTLLGRWRDLKDRVPIAVLVDRVLDESGYEAALLGESLGARKRANARKLVRLAREFGQHGGFTIADLVASLRAGLRESPREEQAATTEEEGTSIRLMSIHQAKGLEFPIVVLPDLNRQPQGGHDFVALSPRLGPIVRLNKEPEPGDESEPGAVGKSLGWLTHRAIEQHEDDQEALRLFYVAITRAQDALILAAGLDPAEKAVSPALTLLFERFDRHTGACRVDLPDGWRQPQVHVTLEPPPRSEAPAIERSLRPPLLDVAKTIDQAVITAEPARQPPWKRQPRFVDLDATSALPPYLDRLDRLIRAILADPRAFEPARLARVAAEIARRQQPAAPPRLVGAAAERLHGLVEGSWAQRLASADQIERGLRWTLAWPPESPERTVFEGTIDFLLQNESGGWSLVVVALAESLDTGERRRLFLGTRAAAALGFRPIEEGVLLRFGAAGLQTEEPLGAVNLAALGFEEGL